MNTSRTVLSENLRIVHCSLEVTILYDNFDHKAYHRLVDPLVLHDSPFINSLGVVVSDPKLGESTSVVESSSIIV